VGPAVWAIVFRQHFIFSSFPANKLERRRWAAKGQAPHGRMDGGREGRQVCELAADGAPPGQTAAHATPGQTLGYSPHITSSMEKTL
jgi:hypothetical protein